MSDTPARPRRTIVFLSDGTLSTLDPGRETNVGLLFHMLAERAPRDDLAICYDAGIQGAGLQRWVRAASGSGINASIRAGYAFLAEHYRPGDRIFLFGYSRGAYAVRSLAGLIGQIGLVKARYCSPRSVLLAFRYYQRDGASPALARFRAHRCHTKVPIEMLGVWDTVKSLGLPYPVIHRLAPMATEFHDHGLGEHIQHGYHALSIDEDRQSFRPILWRQSAQWEGRLEQTWFAGAHGDVAGDVRSRPAARPLGNVSLNWMLRRAHALGLDLPPDWAERFPEDPAAPMVGSRRGIGRFFLIRAPRRVGQSDGEVLHLSIRARMAAVGRYHPRAPMEGLDTTADADRYGEANLPGLSGGGISG